MNVFASRQVTRAFAQAEQALGGGFRFTLLADGRKLAGTMNRVRLGQAMLSNGVRVNADAIIVATRPQFTPAGGAEILPAELDELTFSGLRWRAEFVESDETHVTLFCCRASNQSPS